MMSYYKKAIAYLNISNYIAQLEREKENLATIDAEEYEINQMLEHLYQERAAMLAKPGAQS